MSLSGLARIELGDTERPDRRLFPLSEVPGGASVEIVVGVLAPHPAACRIISAHMERIEIRIVGAPWNVGRWLDLVVDPDILMAGVT